MAEDPYCLEERIISDLDSCIKKDTGLQEFDVIPVSESTNRSPVVHISHNIGLESWCVKTVFMYCYENIFKINSLWRREHLRLERYTKMALLLNPNISTFWNMRKNLINHHYLEAKCDLLLTKLVLSQKPKCIEALTHRRWLISHSMMSPEWIENEIQLCNQLSNRMKCNYHAWSHRQWVFDRAIKEAGFDLELWMSEFQNSEDWSKFHVSDHSGWHYRKFLLNHLKQNLSVIGIKLDMIQKAFDASLSNTNSVFAFYAKLLQEEIRKNGALIMSYNGHETLWYYRRFLLELELKTEKLDRSPSQTWTEEMQYLEKCYDQINKSNLIIVETSQRRLLDQHRLWLSKNLRSFV